MSPIREPYLHYPALPGAISQKRADRISPDYYEKQYQKLELALQEQASEIIQAEKPSASNNRTFSGNWKKIYEKLDYEHRKCFWKSILAEIQIDSATHKVKGFRLLTDSIFE